VNKTEIVYLARKGDAFGLLSLDWSGEAIELGERHQSADTAVEYPRALCGAGLLYLWADRLIETSGWSKDLMLR